VKPNIIASIIIINFVYSSNKSLMDSSQVF
jgi:hypothetical protein